MKNKSYFTSLLAENKIKQLIKELLETLHETEQNDLHDNILLISSRFNRNEDRNKERTISESNYNLELNRIISSLKDYLNELQKDSKKYESIQTKSIFISYNHKDKAIANKIKQVLKSANLIVKIDSETMLAGEDIQGFIDKSISETDVTMSIVSTNSLLSSWVALESIQTFFAQKVIKKQFIAGYIDSSFFNRDFVDKGLDLVELEIGNLQEAIKKRLEKNRNINDLQTELERFNDLKHNLPKIVERLKSSLSIDISNGNFDLGMEKIINSIKN